jgi:hypothetical protein
VRQGFWLCFALLSSVCGCAARAPLSVRTVFSLGEGVVFRPDRILTLRLGGGRRVSRRRYPWRTRASSRTAASMA